MEMIFAIMTIPSGQVVPVGRAGAASQTYRPRPTRRLARPTHQQPASTGIRTSTNSAGRIPLPRNTAEHQPAEFRDVEPLPEIHEGAGTYPPTSAVLREVHLLDVDRRASFHVGDYSHMGVLAGLSVQEVDRVTDLDQGDCKVAALG
ncbi:hypothetical protein [Microbispora sp. NBC_01389]|uniref:hypothetical protein n=1 Tax=Microbispora sp. NBC_01389 TaxID=2903584 RepID=UPI003245C946